MSLFVHQRLALSEFCAVLEWSGILGRWAAQVSPFRWPR